MPLKSVYLALVFDEITPDAVVETESTERYVAALCAQHQAHLSVFLAVPIFYWPSSGLIPLAHALVDEINAKRRAHAEAAEARIASAAAIGGFTAEFHIVQQSSSYIRDRLSSSARLSDFIILPRPGHRLSAETDVIQLMLFRSGRPVLVIPPNWDRGADHRKIMIAWDGGIRAARAVGDAMPFLTRAEEIEILCVSPDTSKSIAGVDLAAHLARHAKSVIVTDLETQHGDVAQTLRAHMTMARADLLVMGAFAHPHLLQMMLGGVTRDMLSDAEVPLLLSY